MRDISFKVRGGDLRKKNSALLRPQVGLKISGSGGLPWICHCFIPNGGKRILSRLFPQGRNFHLSKPASKLSICGSRENSRESRTRKETGDNWRATICRQKHLPKNTTGPLPVDVHHSKMPLHYHKVTIRYHKIFCRG